MSGCTITYKLMTTGHQDASLNSFYPKLKRFHDIMHSSTIKVALAYLPQVTGVRLKNKRFIHSDCYQLTVIPLTAKVTQDR